ncbi:iron-containing alcohol dehydrogenase family protein [Sedimentibacter sp.]|uniref:iron-containing alcohol dehydrogenase family protein n=1 Tax=Sedimentibacter sp. TaxID=1960295 RepID=UPI0028A12A6C|nr:iron-containing alcohol dehydrogenase family protein [Sedimentibacter sp.]
MKTQFCPGYTIGSDAYEDIVKICGIYGKKAAVIGGERAMKAAEEKIKNAVEGNKIQITGFFPFGKEASIENIERLKVIPEIQEADMIFAVGGGKAIDTGKVLAQTTDRVFFAFPTIASTCASCTSLGIIYHPDGSLREYSFSNVTPVHIFIDSEIIANAPDKYFWAGIGDSMAKYFESSVSSRGDELNHSQGMGVNIAAMCNGPFVKHGVKALEDCKNNRVSDELEEIILGIIISTGYVSNMVNIDLNTGLAHAVYNGFTVIPQIEKHGHLHGEIVSYGILVLLAADKQKEELERIYKFNKEMGFPTMLSELHCSMDDVDKVIEKALKGIDVRHYPYTVTPEMIKDAIMFIEDFSS